MKKIMYVFIGLLITACSAENQQQQTADTQQMQMQNQQTQRGIKLDWKAPGAWEKEQPSSSMRLAQYSWPGPEGAADAEMAVFNFPGTGGTVEMNLERWYGQFEQPDGQSTKELAEKRVMSVNGMPATIVYVTGTYLDAQSPMMMSGPVEEQEDYAMLAAIIESGSSPWFFKAIGPRQTIDEWRTEFTEFVKSIRKQT